MNKRFICVITILATVMSMLCIFSVAQAGVGFTDLKANAYYYDAVEWAVESGVTSGTSATEFSPNATCTRAQVVSFLWRAAGSPAVSGGNPFSDISTEKYYYQAVLWAVENGITSGVSADRFDPNGKCTRAQVVSFLWRAASSPAVSAENPFYDVDGGKYYYKPVLWAVGSGVTSGVSATSFAPDSVCTRAQVVSFLHRFYNPLYAKIKPVVYKKDGEQYMRDASDTIDLATLGKGEFFTFNITLKNQSAQKIAVNTSYVMINDKRATGWASFTLDPSVATNCHVYCIDVENIQKAGSVTIEFFANEKKIAQKTFVVKDSSYADKSNFWGDVFPIPTAQQIANYKNPNDLRSQYIAGWWNIGNDVRFTEYTVDFKADYLPVGTYSALANFYIDYTPLEKNYTNIRYDFISGYAGLQNTHEGKKAIMSMWDIYATEKSTGKNVTLRPKVVYAYNNAHIGGFTGEGDGAQCLPFYDWESSHWYRMTLKCHADEKTGNTLITCYVCDLETMVWTKLCTYDTLIKNTCFKGNLAVFLENYLTQYAGDVRTMEVKNGAVRLESTGEWKKLDSLYIHASGPSEITGKPYDGSYAYGMSGDTFWMITSGVGGDWYNNGIGQKPGWFTLK